jgi:surface antigen
MARIGLFLALGMGGLAVAGCAKTGGFNAEASPAAATVAAAGLNAGARKAAKDAEYRALEFGRTGTPVAWQDGKSRGEVVPGPLYHVNASDCRDFTHTVYVGGAPHATHATACRQPNGTWQPVS